MQHDRFGDMSEEARELESVVEIQQRLLSPVPCDSESIAFAVRYLPCARAGGDFYIVRKMREHHYSLVIADMAGHGAGAAVVMAMFRAWLSAFRLGWQPIESVASGINSLWTEVDSLSTFATATFVEVNEKSGRVRSINCGHPPALVVSPSGAIRELRHDSTLPLGILPDLETPIVEDTLQPGDTLALYTDGFTEARSPSGGMLGIDGLRASLARAQATPDVSSMAGHVLASTAAFQGPASPADDQCLLLTRLL